jgi:uncharacterized protein YdeI (YjbR/CyaY-like superfamily)
MRKEAAIYGKKWHAEVAELRRLLADNKELTEEIKWCKYCYTLGGKNIVIIIAFKESVTLTFFRGLQLKDPAKLLEKIGANTQSGRRIKFISVEQIVKNARNIKAYVADAIAVEKSGVKVETKKPVEEIPVELVAKFKLQPALKKAFEALTPGRRRAYLLHFNGAKQPATRAARIEKYAPQILAGQGINDAWKISRK